MLTVRTLLTNFTILIIIIINVFADDLLDSKEEFNKGTENVNNKVTSSVNDVNNSVTSEYGSVGESITNECNSVISEYESVVENATNGCNSVISEMGSLHVSNQKEIEAWSLPNCPTQTTRLPITYEKLADDVASNGTCGPIEKENIKAEVYNLLEIHLNANNANRMLNDNVSSPRIFLEESTYEAELYDVEESTCEAESYDNDLPPILDNENNAGRVPNNEDNESAQKETLELPQSAIQQHYLVKGNHNIDSFSNSNSHGNARPKFNSNSRKNLHAQQVNIFLNADSIYLRNTTNNIIEGVVKVGI